ncbi:MAG: hypothetical protein AAGI22_15095, partial [Planctomycetota bacterium]
TELILECVQADEGEIARQSRGAFRSADDVGAFEFRALPKALYRLVVRGEHFAERVIERVRPGGDPLEIILSERKSARLCIEAGEQTARIEVVVVRLDEESEAQALGSVDLARARSPFVWGTYGRAVLPEGTVRAERCERVVARGRMNLSLAPGRMWIGVTGRDVDLQPLSTVSSGLVRIEAESTVDLRAALVKTVEASGRVVLADGESSTWIALVDDEGRFFRATATRNGERRGKRIFATGRHGHFALAQVPVGRWKVWVGTREELERQAPRHREPVVAREGERLEITIEL